MLAQPAFCVSAKRRLSGSAGPRLQKPRSINAAMLAALSLREDIRAIRFRYVDRCGRLLARRARGVGRGDMPRPSCRLIRSYQSGGRERAIEMAISSASRSRLPHPFLEDDVFVVIGDVAGVVTACCRRAARGRCRDGTASRGQLDLLHLNIDLAVRLPIGCSEASRRRSPSFPLSDREPGRGPFYHRL